MAGIRIYTRFYDETGMPWAVTVYDKTVAYDDANKQEIPMGATPLSIRWSGDQLKYIVGSEVTLTYVTNIDMSWLRTATTDQLLVTVWKNPTITAGVWDIFDYYTTTDTPTKIWWVGYILADSYSRELRIDPTYTINATDRLGTLANYDYCSTPGVTPTYRHQKMLTALGNALQTVKIYLPIVSTVNLFETTMDKTDADDPMDQLYLDELNFCDEDLELGTSYDVIDRIMRIFKTRIFQAGGYWFIQRLDAFKQPQVKYRAYTFGIYTYPYSFNSVVSHVKTINKTDFVLLFCANEEIAPAYKKIDVTQTYGKLTSMFPGFTFEDQEFNEEDPQKPLHWQYSQQLGGVTSTCARYPIGDNNALVSRSTTSDLTMPNRGYLESPKVPLAYNMWDGLLLQIDIGQVWSGNKPTQWNQTSGHFNGPIDTSLSIKVFFVEDDLSDIWLYRKYGKNMGDMSDKWEWLRSDYNPIIFTSNVFTSVDVIPSTDSLENLQKIEIYIATLPSTATQGTIFIRIIDPNTNYGTWSPSSLHYHVHLCVDNVILLFAPKPDANPLGPSGVYRYYDTKLITTEINAENRVNVSYPLDLGNAPDATLDFPAPACNLYSAYSGLLNLSSTAYTVTNLWQEVYTVPNKIKTYRIETGGSGYDYSDIITITPPGDGLSFSAVVNGHTMGYITSLLVNSYGSDFTVGVYATNTNNAGKGCTITVTEVETTTTYATPKILTDWIIDGYAENETPSMIVRGAIRGAADYWNTVQFSPAISDSIFLPQDVEFDVKAVTWSGSWIEMKGMMIPTEYTSEVEPRKSLQK